MEVSDQPPVVFVHGVMGSKLRNKATGEDVWPGSFKRILFCHFEEISLTLGIGRYSAYQVVKIDEIPSIKIGQGYEI